MKFLKLKLHHLSYYLINLYDDGHMAVEFVMYNYNDTSNNKQFKVSTVSKVDITPSKLVYSNTFSTEPRVVTSSYDEPCTQECYTNLRQKLEENIDQILDCNKSLKSLKGIKRKMSYEQKQSIKREKKELENTKSIYKSNLKTVLKELFEGKALLMVVNQ